MPRNVYFSEGTKSEQNLVEDLVIESLRIYGFDLYYLPRTMISRDMILNEEIESRFSGAYMIEGYMENTGGFGGDGIFLSKFGLQIREQATFVVSKKVWNQLVGLWNTGIISNRPAEGDVIYLPMTKSFFEIKFVDHQSPFYQLTNVPVYKLQCELMEYNNHSVKTGVPEIDQLENQFSTEVYLQIAGGSGMFSIGEQIQQVLVPEIGSGSGATPAQYISGKVVQLIQKNPSDPLRIAIGGVASNTGEFEAFQVTGGNFGNIVGQTSGASWPVTKVYDIDDPDLNLTFVSNDQEAQNFDIQAAGAKVIDFSEQNPFGDPSDQK